MTKSGSARPEPVLRRAEGSGPGALSACRVCRRDVRSMTGRSCPIDKQIRVPAEAACEIMHKALPRERRRRRPAPFPRHQRALRPCRGDALTHVRNVSLLCPRHDLAMSETWYPLALRVGGRTLFPLWVSDDWALNRVLADAGWVASFLTRYPLGNTH
jgi:hypothetical protein